MPTRSEARLLPQPTSEREWKTPLYDVVEPLHRAPVEAWTHMSVRMDLLELLQQIGQDLAISYREWSS